VVAAVSPLIASEPLATAVVEPSAREIVRPVHDQVIVVVVET
jgi:hypothetical protein